MKITNNQISVESKNLLTKLKGLKINSLTHEKFTFSPTSYGEVYINIGKKNYILTDYYRIKEHFGYNEEISAMEFQIHEGKISSTIKKEEFISEIINQKISKVTLVNTKQEAIHKITKEAYLFLDTYGIIFTLENNYQISFLKDDFGEQISIYKGYDSKSKFIFLEKALSSNLTDEFETNCQLFYEEM